MPWWIGRLVTPGWAGLDTSTSTASVSWSCALAWTVISLQKVRVQQEPAQLFLTSALKEACDSTDNAWHVVFAARPPAHRGAERGGGVHLVRGWCSMTFDPLTISDFRTHLPVVLGWVRREDRRAWVQAISHDWMFRCRMPHHVPGLCTYPRPRGRARRRLPWRSSVAYQSLSSLK